MTDRGAPRVIDRPQPGFWAVRLGGAGTPEVGAAIIRRTRRSPDPSAPQNIQSECDVLDAFLDGRTVSVDEVWQRRGRPIVEHEYRFLTADRAWARRYGRNEPEAKPWERVNMRKLAPVTPRRNSAPSPSPSPSPSPTPTPTPSPSPAPSPSPSSRKGTPSWNCT